MQNRLRRLSVATGTVCAAVSGNTALAATATVTVSQTPVGKTLQYVGFNQGHYMPGSNTSAWVDYSGVNAFRVWATSSDYEIRHGTEANRDDFAPWGDGVSDLASFNARKTALRADPLNQNYIDWVEFNDRFENTVQSGRNAVKLNYIESELHNRGVHIMQQSTRSAAAGPITGDSDWAGKWEQWQFYYAMAFHSAKDYDVAQWQMYNEPNGDSNTNITDYNIRLKLAGDAIRSAIADVNRLYAKNLTADVVAPTTAGGSARVDDWGKASLQQIRTDYQGQAITYDNFNTYSAQVYGNNGSGFGSEVAGIKSKIPLYHAGGTAAGQAMPVIFSEFNRYTSSNFYSMPETLETPSVFTDIASIYVNAMANGAKAMYAFKFSQTLYQPDTASPLMPQKTGFYYVSETGNKDITGATHAAGVVQLVAKAFKDERNRLSTSNSAVLSNFDSATSYDPATNNYYYFGVNRSSLEPANLTFDLTSWNIAPGTVVSVQEVRNETSGAHNAEVVQMAEVDANRRVTLPQPTSSVWLVTIPGGAKQTALTLTGSADASVHNAAPTTNFGTATNASVGRSPADAMNDDATYLKFNLGATTAAAVNRAIVRVTGQSLVSGSSTNPGPILFHVYALTSDTWTEMGINWTNAPNLDDADAKANGVGTSAFPVGQLTFTGGVGQRVGIDITDLLRDHPEVFNDGQLTLALVREERFTNDADSASSYVDIVTKEAGSASTAPELTLFTAPQATPRTIYWDVNGSLVAGAGGSSPAGAWNGTTRNFNLDSTGSFTGGTLATTTANDTVSFSAGSDGTGTYAVTLTDTQSAAAINIARGNVTFTGGTLATGVFDVASGASGTVSSALSTTSLIKKGTGTLTLTNSQSFTGGTTVQAGTLQLTKLQLNNAVSITGGTLKILDSSPTLPAWPGGNNAFVSRPSSLSITKTAGLYQGTLDLGNNDLIVDYNVAPSPFALLSDMLRSGFNFGDWLGMGITSSAAANPLANGNFALGIAENGQLVNSFGNGTTTGPLFDGQSVDSTTVLIKFTHRIDLDLDGLVTGNDAAVFNGWFSEGDSGATWQTGDVDYDGAWTSNDAAVFNSFYDESLGSLPEPGVAGFGCGIAGLAAIRRRRNR
jgi:autotransporter-associated beta strand protein